MRILLMLIAWAACLSPALVLAAAPLRVCLLTHGAPLSDRASGQGFDVDVARAVAEQLNRPFVPVWITNPAKMTDIDDSDLPLGPLAQQGCDAVPSVPGRDALDEWRETLALSRPYYGAAFELIGPEGTPTDISALRDKRVSVQSVTVAHGVAQAIGLRWSAQPLPADQIAALDTHAVDAALVWGPALAPFDRRPVAGYTPPTLLRWNESFATRTADTALTAEIDSALAALIDSGRIAKMLRAHGMPVHAAFETTFNPAAMRTLQLQGASRPSLQVTTETAVAPAATPKPATAPAATAKPSEAPIAPAPKAPADSSAPPPAAAPTDVSPAAQYEKDAAAVKRGRMIYTGTCGAYCHPASVSNGDAPYLFDCEWKNGGTDQAIFHTIKNGVKGTRMVAFGQALTDTDIWKIVAFLRVNSKCAAQHPK